MLEHRARIDDARSAGLMQDEVLRSPRDLSECIEDGCDRPVWCRHVCTRCYRRLYYKKKAK